MHLQSNRGRGISLKTKMTMAVTMLIAVFLATTGWVLFEFFRQELKASISRDQFTLVATLAAEIDGKIRTTQEHLNAVAQMVTPEHLADRNEAGRFLDLQRDNQLLFDNGMFIFLPQGAILAAVQSEPYTCADECPFELYLQRTLETKAPQISEPFFSTQHPPRPVVMFTTPIFGADGEIAAIMAGSLDLLGDNFLGHLSDIRLGEEGYLYLYNQERTVIVHPDRRRILQRDVPVGANLMFDLALDGFEGTGETVTSWGLSALSSFKRLSTTDWILAANYPLAEAYASLGKIRSHFFPAVAGMLFLSSLSVWLLMRHLTSPLQQLTRNVLAVEEGAETVFPLHKGDEISVLSRAFTQMLSRVEEHRQGLRRQLHFLQILIDAMPNPIFYKDAKGCYLGCNRAFEAYIGITRNDLIGKSVFDLAPPDLAQVYYQADADLFDQGAGEVQVYESSLLFADHTRHEVIFYKATFAEQDGSLGGLVGTFLDISDRKRAEAALMEQQRFSKKLLQNAAVAAFVLDADHRVIVWNAACEELTGTRSEEILGTDDHWKVFYNKQRPCLADLAISGDSTAATSLYDNFRRSELLPEGLVAEGWYTINGCRRYIVFSAAPIRNESGKIIAAIETVEDLTARKTAEEGLQQSHSLVKATLESTADGILVVDLEGDIVSYNQKFIEMWRLPEHLLVGRVGEKVLCSMRAQLTESEVFLAQFQRLNTCTEEESRDSLYFKDGRILDRYSMPQRLGEKIVGRVWSFHDLTRERQALEKLRKLGLAVDQSPNIVVVTDAQGSIEYVNPMFTQVTGYTSEEAIGQNPRILNAGQTPAQYFQTLWQTVLAGREWRGEFQNRKKNGEIYWENVLISPLKTPDGTISHFVAVKEDITERKLAERRQRLTTRVLSLLAFPNEKNDKICDILQLIRDFTGCEAVGIRLQEDGDFPFYRSLGMDEEFLAAENHLYAYDMPKAAECLCGKILLGLTDPALPCCFTPGGSFWMSAPTIAAPVEIENNCLCARGRCMSEGFQSVALIPLRSGEEIIGLMLMADRRQEMVDLDLVQFLEALGASIGIAFERRQVEVRLLEKEGRLDFLANYDPLTRLPNRSLLCDRLQHAMAKARRSGRSVALLHLDLDRFKTINDSLGHEAGDSLLLEVAGRLKASLREVDTLARSGGDEFAIILDEVDDQQIAVRVAHKILDELSRAMTLNDLQLYVTASIGISLYPNDGTYLEDLMQHAEAAMYRAKETGRNNYQFYRPEMNARTRELLLLENSLRQAVEKEELILYFQPKIDLSSGLLTGVEALLRWRHPDLGLISPADFIPLAEETGLIVPIGKWVLRTACDQAGRWRKQGLGPFKMAVNISGRQFRQIDFVDMVDDVLQQTGLDPQWLELEITESVVMENVEETIVTLAALKSRGIHLAIDDFGTGYSSLSYLKRFPINSLKIDRSFISEIGTNPDDAAIAGSVIALAQAMNLEVVAEGIETQEQLQFLVDLSCTQGQGYLFSRPLPEAELVRFLENWMTNSLFTTG